MRRAAAILLILIALCLAMITFLTVQSARAEGENCGLLQTGDKVCVVLAGDKAEFDNGI